MSHVIEMTMNAVSGITFSVVFDTEVGDVEND